MGAKERRDAAILKQQNIVSAANSAGRDLTDEEQAEFESLQREIDDCTKQLEKEKEQKALEESRTRAIEEERARISEIVNLCRQFGVESQNYIEKGTTVQEVKDSILEKQMENGQPLAQGRGNLDVTQSEEDKYRDAASDALLLRAGIHMDHPASGANELRGMRLKDLAVESLEKDGVKNAMRMSGDEVFSRIMEKQYFNPSADFPSIMDQTVQKAYVEGYKMANTTFEQFTSEGSLSDFKPTKHEYLAGPAGKFERVAENGELTSDKPSDALLPMRHLETFGKQFTMTRQAFINDDIGYLTTIPARYARSAKTTVNWQVYEVMIKNSTIHDGIPLFHATHKNLVTKAVGKPSGKAIQLMIVGLSSQKNQFGEPILLRPATIILPVGYGFEVATVFNSATIQTSENTQAANPLYQYRSQISIIEDSTINAIAEELKLDNVPWFMSADRQDCAGIQVDYLNGQKIPTIRRSEVPGVLGFVWDIYLDWGVTVMDHRGLVKNPGEELSLEL